MFKKKRVSKDQIYDYLRYLSFHRKLSKLFDLNQLVAEKHVKVRVEAVRLALFMASFVGGYKAFRALILDM